ncbi:MAG: DUF6265 family protein [Bryobacteraceae bacterium]
MRRVAALAIALMAPAPGAEIAQLAWLEGRWSGSVGKAAFEEHWTAPKAGAMIGMSRMLSGERMAGFEYLRIVSRDADLFYVAQPGGRPPTEFKLTRLEPNGATFENPAHDHPKIITYRRDGDDLVATIEGDAGGKQRRQEFRMRRVR